MRSITDTSIAKAAILAALDYTDVDREAFEPMHTTPRGYHGPAVTLLKSQVAEFGGNLIRALVDAENYNAFDHRARVRQASYLGAVVLRIAETEKVSGSYVRLLFPGWTTH